MADFKASRPMSWPQVIIFLTGLAALTVIHAYFVVPRIIADSRVKWCQDIDTTAAAIRSENAITIRSVEDRLRNIEVRGARVEDKVDRLIERSAVTPK
jgi:hypothetical protein